ncbi:MAG: RNA polymerase sigma factor [Gemmataceae bacterium]
MAETPRSLLERLRIQADPQSWQRLVDLYAPLLRNWLRHYGVSAADADDVVQDVLAVLVREIPHFRHDLRRGAFRRWLRGIMVNRLRVFWRERQARTSAQAPDPDTFLQRLEDPSSELNDFWDREHDRQILQRLLTLLEPEFEATTWQAFRLVAVEGRSHLEAAQHLGLSPNAVRIAKSRVLKRMRQEAEGLID